MTGQGPTPTRTEAVQALLPDGCTLTQAEHHGHTVWAARVQAGSRLHVLTLTDGTPCWGLWSTLDVAAEALACGLDGTAARQLADLGPEAVALIADAAEATEAWAEDDLEWQTRGRP